MNSTKLVDRLRSVLEVYYDWVQVGADEGGVVRIRVGKRHPTDRDLEEFRLRVEGEIGNEQTLSDVKLLRQEGEIVGAVCPKRADAAEKLIKQAREFDKNVAIKEEDELELSRFLRLPSKALYSHFECASMQEATERVEAVHRFLGENGFERVEEGLREDTYVNSEGMVARVDLVVAPAIAPFVRLAIYVPKSSDDIGAIRRYFGLSEAAVP